MRRALALVLVWLSLAFAPVASAQQPSANVTMNADRTTMEVGEIFRLTVEARVQGASNVQVQLPDLSAFEVISRQVSTPFSFSFRGNVQMVQSTTRHSLTLRARQPGRIELAPAYVEIGNQRFESDRLVLEVSGAPGDPDGPQPTQDLPPANHVDGMQYDPNGFLRTWVDEGQPYVGQQVTVTVYLYLPQSLRGQPQITQEPSTDGFWTQDLLGPSHDLTPRRQTLNGRSFQVYVLRRFAAFPLQPGELTIGATALSIAPSGIFGIFGGNQPPFSRTGVPLTITARSLPPGAAPGTPHVGSLELGAELDRSQVATGDAVTLTLTATGRGAIEQLETPELEVDGLRVLAPEVRDAVSNPNGVVGGTRTIRWLVVPERPGRFSLGPFTVPVLDPATGTWSVARTSALELTAAGNAAVATAPPSDEAEEPSAGDADPRVTFGPVHTESELERTHASYTEQPWVLGLLAIGPLLFLLALGARAARRIAESDDPSRAPKRARKAAKKRLAAAREHAVAEPARRAVLLGDHSSALKEVLEAKLGHAVGSLTYPELRGRLGERGMDESLASEIVDELEGCDFARFSAVGVSGDEMESCLDRTRALLVGLDRFTPNAETDE